MKFSMEPFSIDQAYAERLRHKISAFKSATDTNKAVFLTLVSAHGLAPGAYAYLVQNDITMEALFGE